MKILPVEKIKIDKTKLISKNPIKNIRPIKNYTQYLKEYGLK